MSVIGQLRGLSRGMQVFLLVDVLLVVVLVVLLALPSSGDVGSAVAAPSPTATTPFAISERASLPVSSFCVAEGMATSHWTLQIEPLSTKCEPGRRFVY